MSNSGVQLVALSKTGDVAQHLCSCTQVLFESALGDWSDSDRGRSLFEREAKSILSYHLAFGWLEHELVRDTAAAIKHKTMLAIDGFIIATEEE